VLVLPAFCSDHAWQVINPHQLYRLSILWH